MVVASLLLGWFRIYEPNPNALLAYKTVEAILTGKPTPTPTSKTPPRGVFVTIESDGKVLGCRGNLEPTESTLELEIQHAARSATQFDPRYHRVNLKGKPFAVTVTIVERSEPIGSVQGLGPETGLILTSTKGTGIVLPWEGKDPQTRLKWAYQKAKTLEGTSVSLKRLIAERFRFPEL